MKTKMKALVISVYIEDSAFGTTLVGKHSVSIDGEDGTKRLEESLNTALISMNEWYNTLYRRTSSFDVVAKFIEDAAMREGRKEEAEKYKEGGDMWKVQNRANQLESENSCLKKQVEGLIEQLSGNIERERKDGTL